MKELVTVNGFEVEATYSQETLEQVIRPLVSRMRALHDSEGHRILVFLAATPAAGKSTLAAVLERMCPEIQTIGLDGFHFGNEYLRTHILPGSSPEVPLSSIKGAPETFDVAGLTSKLDQLTTTGRNLEPTGGPDRVRFPLYDRRIHEPVQDAVCIGRNIILLEGNWLLLDEDPWRGLRRYADLTISMSAEEDLVRNRLIERKHRGGMSWEDAENWYRTSDGPNVKRFRDHLQQADLCLLVSGDGEIRLDTSFPS